MTQSVERKREPRSMRIRSEPDWDEVQRLLLGREETGPLDARREEPVLRARDVSKVLPRAVELSLARNGDLSRAILPAVESALLSSVQRDPAVLIGAVYPVLWRAARRAVGMALARRIRSAQETLKHWFSWRCWALQWESVATGHFVADGASSSPRRYRVEQVFLIHQQSGLLLRHVASPEVRVEDTDMVSGMLTAIQDFARDSFHLCDQEPLREMRVGNLTVWVESGPHAYLAAVVHGTPPEGLRARMREAVEEIHLTMDCALERFAGDPRCFVSAGPALERCLEIRCSQETPVLPWKWIAWLLLLAGAVGWWA